MISTTTTTASAARLFNAARRVKPKPNPSKETPSQKEPTLKYNNYCFCIDDALILEMLSKLEAKYLNNYSDWLIVMSVLRSLDKFEIFDEWSKNTSHYNRTTNTYGNRIREFWILTIWFMF